MTALISIKAEYRQGNEKLYRRLLDKFYQSQFDFLEQFKQARQSDDDPEAATRAAHTLKGVAGNIGAGALQQAAEAWSRPALRMQLMIN